MTPPVPRPRDPFGQDVPATGDDAAGQEEVLSYLHGIAVSHQPEQIETGPVMVPVAFAGRVSDKDLQDPTLSIPRQVARCRAALPPYCVIVAFFWDVESGRIGLELRGHGDAHEMFAVPVPRDGGVADLFEEARQPDRRFVAVVCESVDRLARVTYFGTKIEYELEQSGVALLAADEGITGDALPSPSGVMARKRATPILTRRVKQAIAEWYILDMMEKSWGGLVEHTEQGFNIGKPPYGYQVVIEKHPVPAKAALGKVKRRLVRDEARGVVVTQIYTWRISEHLSYGQIAERLNTDPGQYPPPKPILGRGRRAVGAWTKGSVRDVLCNPKYTGHMVYNRRKNPRQDRGVAGRVNPRTEWVWSSKPTHEPLTTRSQFEAGTPIGKSKRGSRTSDKPNIHPATTHTYRLRSHVICDICGRRFYGKVRRVLKYYACEVYPKQHAEREWFDSHPKSIWIREDKLLELVRSFFARRIFGPDRGVLFEDSAGPGRSDVTDARAVRTAQLRSKIKDLERQQANVVKELREYLPTGDEDIDQEWRRQLRDSFADLANGRKKAEIQLAELANGEPATPTGGDPRLLEQLPVLQGDLPRIPEELERQLFTGFQLQVRYHQPTGRVTLRVTLDDQSLPRLIKSSRAALRASVVTHGHAKTTEPSAAEAAKGPFFVSLARRAPGRIRTCAPASGGRSADRLSNPL